MKMNLDNVKYEVCKRQKTCKTCPIQSIESDLCITGIYVEGSPVWRKYAEILVPYFADNVPSLVWLLDDSLKQFLPAEYRD